MRSGSSTSTDVGELLQANEVEAVVSHIEAFSLQDVGSPRWMRQHEFLQKLNAQAHYNAATQSEEIVMEALITYDKFAVLVNELLTIEVWQQHVYPFLKSEVAASTKSYFIMYHEALLMNLLEITLYHRSACKSAGDSLLDLLDYCYRKITTLSSSNSKPEDFLPPKRSVQQLLEISKEVELAEKAKTTQFTICISSLAILRFMTDYIDELSLSLLTKMLNFYDVICILVLLIEQPPWVRREGGKVFKFELGQWKVVPASEIQRLVQPEIQVWLSIYNLVMDPECRKVYAFSDQRKQIILKLRGYLTEVVVDQVPILEELKKAFHELSVLETPPLNSKMPTSAIIEQISETKERLGKTQNYKDIADFQKKSIFSVKDSLNDMQRLSKSLEEIEQAMPTKCAQCGKPAAKKCSRCKNEWYCERECQLKAWKVHKPMCDLIHEDLTNRK